MPFPRKNPLSGGPADGRPDKDRHPYPNEPSYNIKEWGNNEIVGLKKYAEYQARHSQRSP